MLEGFYLRGSTTHRLGILCTGMGVIWKQRMLELHAVFNFFVRAEHICTGLLPSEEVCRVCSSDDG